MRRYELDWLRVIVFGLLIFYHVGMFFVPWGFHIKNNQIYQWLIYPMLFVNQWRLPILFVISGMGTAYALNSRSGAAFAKERITRLLLPLIAGIILIVPPQVYFERISKDQFSGSYLDFWPANAFIGIYPEGNFSWHHLWFLVYLVIFSLMLIPAFLYLRKYTSVGLLKVMRKITLQRFGLYWLIIPLFIWEAFLEPFFPSTHAFWGDWFNVVNYLTLFFYGFLLISVKDIFWKIVADNKGWYLTAGIFGFSIFLIIKIAFEDSMLIHFIEAVFKVFNLWSWILALFGYTTCYLQKTNKFLTYSNEAVYPFYILHQTITIGIGYYLQNLEIAFAAKFSIMAVGTFGISWLIYEFLIRRFNWVRPLFGLKTKALITQRSLKPV